MNTRVRWLLIISSAVFFLLAVISELQSHNLMSCILVIIMLLEIMCVVLPKLITRFKRKNTKFVNFVNMLAIIVFVSIIAYVTFSLTYYLIFGHRMFSFFEAILYPAILFYLLIESYINFMVKEEYKYFSE